MVTHQDYSQYLHTRSRLGLLYRNLILYPRLRRHLRGKALDIGSGIGDMLRFRADTVGVDINPHLVEFCRSQGLQAHVMVPDVLPFAVASFQSVILDNVLEHIEQPRPLLGQIHQVLTADGTLLVGVPGKRGYASDPDHKIFYTEAALRECVEQAGFKLHATFHMPFRSRLLNECMRQYAVYGVFRRISPQQEPVPHRER